MPDAVTLAQVPVMATTPPPGVSDTGTAGSETLEYAGKHHTHASKARKQIVTMGSAASTYTWVYPAPFAEGVIPIVNAIVQVPNGNTDLFNVQVIGAPTNTQCVFQINRVSMASGPPGLTLLGIGINPTPIAATLHMLALEP
jgi:hypothetical protein